MPRKCDAHIRCGHPKHLTSQRKVFSRFCQNMSSPLSASDLERRVQRPQSLNESRILTPPISLSQSDRHCILGSRNVGACDILSQFLKASLSITPIFTIDVLHFSTARLDISLTQSLIPLSRQQEQPFWATLSSTFPSDQYL
jgi:hypothetical protein